TNLPANKIDTVRFDWADGTVRNDSSLQRDHVYTTPDTYAVEATLDAVSDLRMNGSDTVEVEASPEARVNATPLYAARDESVTFDAADSQSYNGSLTYEWDLDPAIDDGFDVDRTTGDPDTDVAEAYTGIGEKEIEVRVTDEGGLTDRRRIRFAVTKFDANVTTAEVTSGANDTIEIEYPVDRGYIANVSVDFGDGESTVVEYGDNNLAGKPITVTHNYSSTGDYDITATLNTTYGYTENTNQTVTATEPTAEASGPVTHYEFDDTSDTGVATDSAASNHGSIEGGATYTSNAIRGTALDLEPDDAIVRGSSLNPDNVTAAVWVKWLGPAGHGPPIVFNEENEYEVSVADDGTVQYAVQTGTSWQWRGSEPIERDRWTHVAITHDGTASALYVDGQRAHKFSNSGPITHEDSILRVGNRGSSDTPGRVVVDDLRVYDYDLGSTGVTDLYDRTTPVADAGANKTVQTDTTVSFDGSGSHAPSGATYEWEFGDNTTGTGATETHTYDAAGSYTATVTVTDDDGRTATATTTIEVLDGTPESCSEVQSSLSDPSTGEYTIDPDGDGDTLSVTCNMDYDGGGWTVVDTATAYELTRDVGGGISWYTPNDGYYAGTEKAYDGTAKRPYALDGGGGHFAVYDVDLGFPVDEVAVRDLRWKALSDRAGGSRTELGGGSTPRGYAWADESGGIQWGTQKDALAGWADGDDPNDLWCHDDCERVWAPSDGTYKDYATDADDGLRLIWTESGGDPEGWQWDGGRFLVRGALSYPPAASANATPGSAVVGEGITFDASASSDPGGSIQSYEWSFGDGSANATDESVVHTYDAAGTYTATVTVTDDDGTTGSDSVTVTVGSEAIDDFERGDITPYSGDTGSFQATTTAVEGTYALRGDRNNDAVYSSPGDGLTAYPDRGETIAYRVRIGDPKSGGQFIFGGTDKDSYLLRHDNWANTFRVARVTDGSYTGLDATSVDWQTDTWYRVVVEWGDPWINATLYRPDGTEVAAVAAKDRNYTASDIGFATYATNSQASSEMWFDDVRTVGDAPTRPIADVGANRTVRPNTTVSFDGSGSSDVADSITDYEWSFGDGTTGTGATVDHAYTAEGEYPATLTVTDEDGDTDTATATVTVQERTNRSCTDVLAVAPDATSGTHEIDANSDGVESTTVYCDMDTAGGGWTLVASVADDGSDYWTHTNRKYLWEGNQYGSVDSAFTSDYQSAAWDNVSGDGLLVRRADTASKHLVYDGVLSNQTLASRYTGTETTIGTFYPDTVSGNWWYQCGDLGMRLQTPDSDHHGWESGGYGLIWKSDQNGGCSWDDVLGNFHESTQNDEEWTSSGEKAFFYDRNFADSAALVFVRDE
ncbi:hypothetical protein BRD17_01870, partial [Halobacteriales archaeon SW_7_68_16]